MKSASLPSATNNSQGPGTLMFAYLTEAGQVSLAATYADLLLEQPALSLTHLDAGLGTRVHACQLRMKSHAYYVVNSVLPKLIDVISGADNFDALINAGLKQERVLILEATTQWTSRSQAIELARALEEEAQAVHTDASTLATRLLVLENSMKATVTEYAAALDAALETIDAAARHTVETIDSLNASTAKNIDDIVKGNIELGGAITTLGIGVLTTIQPALEGPAEGASEEARDGGDGVPSAAYAIKAIGAGSKGVESSSRAALDLEEDNKKLASAYQDLAKSSELGAIAKSVGAQNQLFAEAVSKASASAHSLAEAWSYVAMEFESLTSDISTLSDHEDAIQLTSKIPEASLQWSALGGELKTIKQQLTRSGGGLPAVGP